MTKDAMQNLVREMRDAVTHDAAIANEARLRTQNLTRRTIAGLSDAELAELIRVTTNVYDIHQPIRYPGDEARGEAVARFLSRNPNV